MLTEGSKGDQALATSREQVLEVYATEGATAAADLAGVSKRTVQRWAAQEGIRSGYEPQITRDCPSAASYTRGCRCEGCKEANREQQRAVKERRVKRFKTGKVDISHGVSGYSNWDCRCGVCGSAWSAYLRERRAIRRKAAKAAGQKR